MKAINILLVDDNEGDILLFLEACEEGKLKKNVSVIKDGKDAIDFLSTALKNGKLPDMILLDVNLPRRNGHQILEHLQAAQTTIEVPVFMFTTSSSPQDRNSCLEKGVKHFITKPMEAHDFLKTVELIEKFWLDRTKNLGGGLQC